MVGITTAGDCSPEGTIDADHSGHDVHFRSFTGSAKVRMSCNVEEQIKVRTEYRMSGVNYKKSNEIEQLLSKFEREVARFDN